MRREGTTKKRTNPPQRSKKYADILRGNMGRIIPGSTPTSEGDKGRNEDGMGIKRINLSVDERKTWMVGLINRDYSPGLTISGARISETGLNRIERDVNIAYHFHAPMEP